MISGSDSAATAEADLRSLAASVLQPVLGANWIARSGALLPKALEKAADRRDQELAERPGAEHDIVFYLELSDIITITLNKWQYFKKVVGPSRARWTQESQMLRTLRNTQRHGRRLVEFEEDLLRGIAGDIRNRVTRYRSEMDPKENWWPRIESVQDSFGSTFTRGTTDFAPPLQIVSTDMILGLDDEVSFTCAGWDPQARELS